MEFPTSSFSPHELKTLPAAIYFPPSETTGYIESKFAKILEKRNDFVVDKLGAVALKTIADCNFRCKGDGYECYEYADDTWEALPSQMSDGLITTTGQRIGEYTKFHRIAKMRIVFHGGEPLYLRGATAADYYDHLIELLETAAHEENPELEIEYSMQTNASLLTNSALEMLKRRNIKVSCSIDGDEEAHNRNRKTKINARGTFRSVDKGIRRLSDPTSEYTDIFDGLLAVVDPRNDPIKTYEALCFYNPKKIDFLLPYANWETPPAIPDGNTSPTPYADWLLTIFRRWNADRQNGENVPDIRTFRSIINLAHGGSSLTEALGPFTSRLAFVRTDGSFEGLDALKMTTRDKVDTNMDVYNNTLEEVAEHLRNSGQLGKKQLSKTCTDCKLVDICGGGHVESRYSSQDGFNNVSVFCEDLKVLIKEIVSTTNAEYRDEVATAKLVQILKQQNKDLPIPPAYSPLILPTRKSLPTRIRPAEPGDVSKIVDLQGEAFMGYGNVVPPDVLKEFIADDLIPRKQRYWKRIVRDMYSGPKSNEHVFVATLGSVVLGFASLRQTRNGGLFLNAHYVSAQTEKYGAGEEMLREFEHATDNPPSIYLRAVKQTDQAAFFEDRGYESIHSTELEPPILKGHALPQVLMVRQAISRVANEQRAITERQRRRYDESGPWRENEAL